MAVDLTYNNFNQSGQRVQVEQFPRLRMGCLLFILIQQMVIYLSNHCFLSPNTASSLLKNYPSGDLSPMWEWGRG